MVTFVLVLALLAGFLGYEYGHDQCSKEQRIAALEYQLHEVEMMHE